MHKVIIKETQHICLLTTDELKDITRCLELSAARNEQCPEHGFTNCDAYRERYLADQLRKASFVMPHIK